MVLNNVTDQRRTNEQSVTALPQHVLIELDMAMVVTHACRLCASNRNNASRSDTKVIIRREANKIALLEFTGLRQLTEKSFTPSQSHGPTIAGLQAAHTLRKTQHVGHWQAVTTIPLAVDARGSVESAGADVVVGVGIRSLFGHRRDV